MSGGQLMTLACFISTCLLILAAASLMLLCKNKFMIINFERHRSSGIQRFLFCTLQTDFTERWILAPITSALIQFGNKFIFHHAVIMVLFCSYKESSAIAELCPLCSYLAGT